MEQSHDKQLYNHIRGSDLTGPHPCNHLSSDCSLKPSLSHVFSCLCRNSEPLLHHITFLQYTVMRLGVFVYLFLIWSASHDPGHAPAQG